MECVVHKLGTSDSTKKNIFSHKSSVNVFYFLVTTSEDTKYSAVYRITGLTALASFPGSGNTWLRYLLQQATGN